MVEKTELSISILPKIESRIEELSIKLEEIIIDKAPEAWNATLTVVQIDGFREILSGIFILILSGLSFWIGLKFLRKVNFFKDDDDSGFGFSGVIAWIISAILLIISTVELLSIWTWTAIFNPELVIAKKILIGIL